MYYSEDLVEYSFLGFLKLSEGEIRRPAAAYDCNAGIYCVEWETEDGRTFRAVSGKLREVFCPEEADRTIKLAEAYDVPGAIPGSVIEISDEECRRLKSWFLPPENTSVRVEDLDYLPDFDDMPEAECVYSDGSVHFKPVDWNLDDYNAVDPAVPGTYKVRGSIRMRHWPFPIELSPGPGAAQGVPGVIKADTICQAPAAMT